MMFSAAPASLLNTNWERATPTATPANAASEGFGALAMLIAFFVVHFEKS
jgi:hypothetical protein